MKVHVGKTLFGSAYTVRLEVAGRIFRTGFQGSNQGSTGTRLDDSQVRASFGHEKTLDKRVQI